MLSKWKERDINSPDRWWFASIGIPLLAATIGPFANVLSIAALVSYWRENLLDSDGYLLPQLSGSPIKDPHWATAINVASLAAGYVGNFFLFCNFTNRVRYLVALPATIVLWFGAAFLVSLERRYMLQGIPPRNIAERFAIAYISDLSCRGSSNHVPGLVDRHHNRNGYNMSAGRR